MVHHREINAKIVVICLQNNIHVDILNVPIGAIQTVGQQIIANIGLHVGNSANEPATCRLYTVNMAFSYYNKLTRQGVIATNLRSISTLSGVSYNTLSNWFRNGDSVHENDKLIIFKQDIIKGRQRLQK